MVNDLNSRIVIAGGGIIGMTMALVTAQIGIPTTLFEQNPQLLPDELNGDLRNLALCRSSKAMLEALGVWSYLENHLQPLHNIIVSQSVGYSYQPSRFFAHLQQQSLDDGQPIGWFVEGRFLHHALRQCLSSYPALKLCYGQKLDWQDRQDYELVINAEGKHSSLRQQAGIYRYQHDYGQMGIVTRVRHDRPHHGVAQEYFRPNGPFAVLPLPDLCSSSLVWVEDTQTALDIVAASVEDKQLQMSARFGDWLGEVRLEKDGQMQAYPLHLAVCEKLYSQNMVLIGDCAHQIHPISGQGFNLGLRDVAWLADLLLDALYCAEDFSNPRLLQRYQRGRLSDVVSLCTITHGLNCLFSNANPMKRLLRNFGIGIVQSMPLVKNYMVKYATGLIGHLPSLLQGQALPKFYGQKEKQHV